jgi:hypothetical protein
MALVILAAPLQAQQVIAPNTRAPLTGERAQIHGSLVALRDSLLLVQSAGGRLERDLRSSSDAVLRSRARSMTSACASSSRAAITAQDIVATSSVPAKDPRGTRAGLLSSLRELRDALDKCQSDFTEFIKPDRTADLRGYGVSRSTKTNEAIQHYSTPLQLYLGAVDIVIEPSDTESKASSQ